MDESESSALSRRGFLGTLMAAIGAAAVVDPVTLLWHPPTGIALPTLETGALVDLKNITLAVAKALEKRWQPRELVPMPCKIGQEGMTMMYTAESTPLPDVVDIAGFHPEYIEAVAETLARGIDKRKATRCGRLEERIPGAMVAGVIRPQSNLYVRGVVQYDIQQDAHRIRFSVLGG